VGQVQLPKAAISACVSEPFEGDIRMISLEEL
jgi:hypothetical protein